MAASTSETTCPTTGRDTTSGDSTETWPFTSMTGSSLASTKSVARSSGDTPAVRSCANRVPSPQRSPLHEAAETVFDEPDMPANREPQRSPLHKAAETGK
ncbi:hypothetical protein, partial [Micrococcus lylae]|uniref:hypothetical protein n=1 Tax=Micrococcus lylae TaxID=1273 RepID=UPI001ADD85A3